MAHHLSWKLHLVRSQQHFLVCTCPQKGRGAGHAPEEGLGPEEATVSALVSSAPSPRLVW